MQALEAAAMQQAQEANKAEIRQANMAVLDFIPIAGDIKGFVDAFNDPTPINIIAASIGLFPGVGDVAAKFLKGMPPLNLSPFGAGRTGAFKEAKRQSGIPVGQQPSSVTPNLDRRGNVQPGKVYHFEVPVPGGGNKTVRIRDDAGGHDFGPGNSQNRGSHFNDEDGNHYDY